MCIKCDLDGCVVYRGETVCACCGKENPVKVLWMEKTNYSEAGV